MIHADPFAHARSNLQFFYKPVMMAGGYEFNHVNTLRRINLYHDSQFETGPVDGLGFYKYFYNIVKPACDVATKFVDLDTKDIIFISERPGEDYKIWMMQKDFRYWVKETKFGELLNGIAFNYPKYGTVVIKKNRTNEWQRVNIENIRLDPSAQTLEQSSFVYEILTMTQRELRDMPWEKEAIEELISRNPSAQHFTVYECYTYDSEAKKKWRRYFVADFLRKKTSDGTFVETPESQLLDQTDYMPGVLLFEDEVDELPYRELHWESVPGRWLGRGFTEYLFDNQIRRNEIVNTKAKGLYFTSLKLYQTTDETIGRNLLTDMENGQILKVASPITPVPMEERNLSAFAEEQQQWDNNTERKTFTFDIARGGRLPSQTPLGVAQLSAAMVASFFDIKRENFGLFIRQLILDDILPSFKKARKKQHLVKFFGSDKEIAKVRKAIVDHRSRKAIWQYALKAGVFPSQLAIDLMRMRLEQSAMKRQDITLEIPEGFYDDVKAVVDIQVTGEQFDSGTRMQTLQVALQIMGANPGIVVNPSTRTIFFKMLELAGVSPVELDLMNEQSDPSQTMGMPVPGGPPGAPQGPQRGLPGQGVPGAVQAQQGPPFRQTGPLPAAPPQGARRPTLTRPGVRTR